MGAIGGMLGLAGGANGTGFAGPASAPITNPVQPGQIAASQAGTANSMAAQQGLLSALQAQNGLGNQNQVYGQLQSVASGAVNPAQAQFAQNTSQNVGNQAALMAGQRGASSNVGLMARQAAQQGAGIQQQAVGQEASQQANNQIAAMGQAGQLATTQAGQQIGQTNANQAAQQAQQTALLNSQAGINNANVSMQGNINSANAGLTQTQMGAQGATVGGGLQGISSSLAKGGEVGHYDDGGDVDSDAPMDSDSVNVTPVNMTPGQAPPAEKKGGGGLGNIMKIASIAAADGGDISLGADTTFQPASFGGNPTQGVAPAGPQSGFGQFISGAGSGMGGDESSGASMYQGSGRLAKKAINYFIRQLYQPKQPAGTSQDLGGSNASDYTNLPNSGSLPMPTGSSGAVSTSDEQMAGWANGGMTHDYRSGGKVNAKNIKEKAVKGGDSYSNDKIPAVLSEHEIVLPRSVTLSKDPVAASAKFVQAVIAKRKARK